VWFNPQTFAFARDESFDLEDWRAEVEEKLTPAHR